MKNKLIFYGIPDLLLALTLILCGCPNPTDGTPKGQEQQETPEQPSPVDPAFWFGEIHAALIDRIGTFTSEEYTGDMGQIANCQYVQDAINAKYGAGTVTLVNGTATQAANCEYLLKMIDKANANRSATNYGTSTYATKQVIDKAAVDTAVTMLWKPAGKFVAVAQGAAGTNDTSNAIYSTDGIFWNQAGPLSEADWNSIAYGNGTFVAIADSSDKVAYSTDGISWTEITLPHKASWKNVTYCNGKFIANAAYDEKAAYSTNGVNWTEITLPWSTSWHWIKTVYGNGKFVVIGFDNSGKKPVSKAAYSTNGIDWTLSSLSLDDTYFKDV
jgi:hypothetical protein